MDAITTVLIGIVILFFILLVLKNIFNLKKFCVICASITLMWIVLLTLYFLNIFIDRMVIAILMGQASLGIFYLWEKKTKEKFKVFRLPLLLTFIFTIYFILESFSLNSLIFIMVLWLIFLVIYLFRTNKTLYSLANKLIECCKKW